MTKSQNTKNEQQKDLCITVEKQVWESTLRRSMVLEAENAKLKEDYKRMGKLLQKMEESDNAREKFQNAQIEKLKELLKECRNKWVCYKPYDRDQLLKRIDEVLK